MSKKYLVVLKNPPVSFMVDSYEKGFVKFMKNWAGAFTQEGLALYIPYSSDNNISYVQEMSDADVEEIKEKIEEMAKQKKEKRAKLLKVQPGFKIPSKKSY